jgi:hypothetical protein
LDEQRKVYGRDEGFAPRLVEHSFDSLTTASACVSRSVKAKCRFKRTLSKNGFSSPQTAAASSRLIRSDRP